MASYILFWKVNSTRALRIFAWYQDCHVTYQLKISYINLQIGDQYYSVLNSFLYPGLHCKCLHTNYRLIIIFRCCYYRWKCVKSLKVVDFKNYRQMTVFSAANSKLHSNYWYLDVKWKCISIYSEIKYINW